MPGPTNLPTNVDTSYDDDPEHPGRKIHQQHHDAIHEYTNTHDLAVDPHGDRAYADGAVGAHAGAADPHPGYATDADLANHAGAADPHPGYLTQAEADAIYAAKSIIDAKGDLLVGTANDTVARLPVSATPGLSLVSDPTDPKGMKWAAAGGAVLLAEQTLAADGSLTFSGIPQTYKALRVHGKVHSSDATGRLLAARFNGDTGANYTGSYIDSASGAMSLQPLSSQTSAFMGTILSGIASEWGEFVGEIWEYSEAKRHVFMGQGGCPVLQRYCAWSHRWVTEAAITSITFLCQSAASIAAGSKFQLYGVPT